MAVGVSIAGVGNVVWPFPCDNSDQMAIILKCYLVPSVNTRLLSPQQIFVKQNGHMILYLKKIINSKLYFLIEKNIRY